MNYFIIRDDQQYGPYTLADLQRYVASGEIAPTDLARSEGMNEALPVSQIVGTIAVPQVQSARGPIVSAASYPDPPNLHWSLVLIFGMLTCGLFNAAWGLVQAGWMKKIAPQSRAMYYYVGAACALLGVYFAAAAAGYTHSKSASAGLFDFVYCVLLLIGRFSLKHSLEKHYNSVEPMGLALSGAMTFFFGDVYFQYHFNDIVRRKNADRAMVLSA